MFLYLYKVVTLGWGAVNSDSVASGPPNPYVWLPTYQTTCLALAGSVTAVAVPSGSGPSCCTSQPRTFPRAREVGEETLSRGDVVGTEPGSVQTCSWAVSHQSGQHINS